jgi:hypothetical protein
MQFGRLAERRLFILRRAALPAQTILRTTDETFKLLSSPGKHENVAAHHRNNRGGRRRRQCEQKTSSAAAVRFRAVSASWVCTKRFIRIPDVTVCVHTQSERFAILSELKRIGGICVTPEYTNPHDRSLRELVSKRSQHSGRNLRNTHCSCVPLRQPARGRRATCQCRKWHGQQEAQYPR